MYLRRQSDIGALIRDRRRKLGWTQAQLAEKLVVPQRTISRLETGAHASRVDLVLAALNILGVRLRAEADGDHPAAEQKDGQSPDVAALVDDMLNDL